MKCQTCRTELEPGLIVCPKCGNDPNVTQASGGVSEAELKVLAKKVRNKLVIDIFAWLGFISLVYAFSLYQVYTSVTKRISDKIEQRISDEFEQPRIIKTVESVASDDAKIILRDEVQPSINSFQATIDKRMADFDVFLKTQRESVDSDIKSLRLELAKVQKRANIMALGDKAIGEGDVEAYRALDRMAADESLMGDDKAVVEAELFRVVGAFGIFSPTRVTNIHLIASVINPKKTKEEELTADEVYPFLAKEVGPLGRAKIGDFLQTKARVGSFKIADAIATDLAKENNLEAFRYLGEAFCHVTGYDNVGHLDCRELLDWWKENRDAFKKKDPEMAEKH